MKTQLVKGYIKNKLVIYSLKDDNYIGNVITTTGNYEAYETSIILENIKKGDIVVDVGANIGFHTLLFADKVGPEGKVYTFEPDPISYKILLQNIQANHFKNIIAKPLAISNKKIKLDLYKSKNNYGDNRVYASDIPSAKLKVQADSLDNLLKMFFYGAQRVTLLKIDTQGFEPFVIEGAKKLIKKHKPILFFEYWPYGYLQSKSDGTAMLNYLKKIYNDLYLINDNNEKITRVGIKFINQYCEQLNGYLHANLFCTTNRFTKTCLFIKDTISKLIDRIN